MLTKKQSHIAKLEAYLGEVDSKDIEFSNSLVDQFKRRGDLSDKQWYHVDKLVARYCK